MTSTLIPTTAVAVYFAAATNVDKFVAKVPVGGGTITTLWTSNTESTSFTAIAVTSTSVYWTGERAWQLTPK